MAAPRTDCPNTAPASRSSRPRCLVEVVLVDVEQDDEGLPRKELEPANALCLIGRELLVADGCLGLQPLFDPSEQVSFLFDGVALCRLRALGILVESLQPSLQQFEIGEEKLKHHVLDVAERVYRAVDVEHGLVVEGARDDEQGVYALEIVQVLAGYPAHPAGRGRGRRDVDVAHHRRHGFSGCVQRGQPLKASVGHKSHPDVRFPAIRGNVGPPPREGVKHRSLAAAGKTYDADFHGCAFRKQRAGVACVAEGRSL